VKDEQIDLVFRAVAHPERRRILKSLHEKPGQSLFEICTSSIASEGLALSRQTISQHLDALHRAGLLETSWKGRTKLHSVNLNPLRTAIGIAMDHIAKKEEI
jgi:DNA-binding transcriptional ArsR family regulator